MNTNIPMTEEEFYETAVKAYNERASAQTAINAGDNAIPILLPGLMPNADRTKRLSKLELTKEATLRIESKIASGELYYGLGNLLFLNPKANVSRLIRNTCKIDMVKLWATLQWLPTLNQALNAKYTNTNTPSDSKPSSLARAIKAVANKIGYQSSAAKTGSSTDWLENIKIHVQDASKSSETLNPNLNPNTARILNEMYVYAKELLGKYEPRPSAYQYYPHTNIKYQPPKLKEFEEKIVKIAKNFVEISEGILDPSIPAKEKMEKLEEEKKLKIEEEEKLYTYIIEETNKRTIIQAYITAHKNGQATPFLDSEETKNPNKPTIKTIKQELYDPGFDPIKAKQFTEQKVANNELYYGLGNILFHNPQAQAQVPYNIKNIRKTSPQKLWVALQWLPTLEKALIKARTKNSTDRLPEDLKAHIQVAPKSSKNQGKIGLAPNTAQHLVEMLKYASTILKYYEKRPIYNTIQSVPTVIKNHEAYPEYTTNRLLTSTYIDGYETFIDTELHKTSKKFMEATNNLLTTLFDPNYGFQKLSRSDAPAKPNEEPILDTALSPAI